MRKFFDANPGFKSRVPDEFHLKFVDYTCNQLVTIGQIGMQKKGMVATPASRGALKASSAV